MRQIISFLINNKYFLLFIILEIIALSLTIQSHSYHRSKFINSSNHITGGIYNNFSSFNNYMNLKNYNEQLVIENVKLKNLLSSNNKQLPAKKFSKLDSLTFTQNYHYIPAKVIKNDYSKSNNYLTLNRGQNDSITKDLGVITSKGIVGVTNNVSGKYATVISILNENSKINARLLKNEHYGTLVWNSHDYKTIQFEDIPRQANIKIGDTVITGGKSTTFPEGILVGTIKDFILENNNYQVINISLFNDMSAIKHVNIITNIDKLEIKTIESKNE